MLKMLFDLGMDMTLMDIVCALNLHVVQAHAVQVDAHYMMAVADIDLQIGLQIVAAVIIESLLQVFLIALMQ